MILFSITIILGIILAVIGLVIGIFSSSGSEAKAEAARARQAGLTREELIRQCLDTMREVKPLVASSCGLGDDATALPQVPVTR